VGRGLVAGWLPVPAVGRGEAVPPPVAAGLDDGAERSQSGKRPTAALATSAAARATARIAAAILAQDRDLRNGPPLPEPPARSALVVGS
jgi:hypothetical protein